MEEQEIPPVPESRPETPEPETQAEPEVIATEPAATAEVEQATMSMEELLAPNEPAAEPEPVSLEDTQLLAVLEAVVYVAEEPLALNQIAAALEQPAERIRAILDQLIQEFDRPHHGVTIREVAG